MTTTDYETLLGRRPRCPDTRRIADFYGGKSVLITGAAGSIGSAITRMLYGVADLTLMDKAEGPLSQLADEMPGAKAILRDVSIDPMLDRTIQHTVFHCAAHKHVPFMENNVAEAVRNNFDAVTKAMGWMSNVMNTARKTVYVAGSNDDIQKIIAAESGEVIGLVQSIPMQFDVKETQRFMFCSTDKAVDPSCVMGMTKRLAELHVVQHGGTVVRFGNVLDSSGSVLQIWRRQIERGEPLTITHPEMTRYFMTLEEAAGFVLEAMTIAGSGDTFVMDMGEPVKIIDLAKRFNPNAGIQINGARPGEKFHEKLHYDHERLVETEIPGIRLAVT